MMNNGFWYNRDENKKYFVKHSCRTLIEKLNVFIEDLYNISSTQTIWFCESYFRKVQITEYDFISSFTKFILLIFVDLRAV